MMVTSPHAVLPSAGDDVVDFDCLRELGTMSAFVKSVLFFDEVLGIRPAMIVPDRVRTFAGTPSGLATRQFLSAQFAVASFAGSL